MLVSTFGVMALLLFGSLALVAGSLSFQSSAGRNSDGEQAAEAAEWGFNSLIERLNQPAYRHLLVTKWSGNNWVQGAGTARASCGINTAAAAGMDDIRSGSREDVGNLQVAYTLRGFVPPPYPGSAPDPDPCNTFGNRAGGTARLTVEGRVSRSGEVIATHTIVRDITVEAEVFTPPPVSPPLALLVTGSGSTGGSISSSLLRYDGDSNWQYTTADSTRLPLYCLVSCTGFSSSGYTRSGYSPANFLTNFRATPPANETSAGLGSIGSSLWGEVWGESGKPGVPQHFPYADATFTGLLPYCKEITLPTSTSGPSEAVIGCKIKTLILKDSDFVVRTDKTTKPVVVYIMGNANTFLLETNRKIVNQRFVDTRVSDPESWGSLRIYGDPATSGLAPGPVLSTSTASSLSRCLDTKQVFEIKSGAQIQGVFLWIPKGELNFQSSSSAPYGLFGALWACKINSMASGFKMLANENSTTTSYAIDRIFGRERVQIRRYFTRGVERSLTNSP